MPTLHEFLDRFGSSLAERVATAFRTLHDPFRDQDPGLDSRLAGLMRPCYPAQAEAAKALAKALFQRRRRAAYVCGEMGVGKSQVALALLHLSPAPLRTLVLCPPHLTPKWAREAASVIPDVHTFDLNGPDALSRLTRLADALRAGASTHPDRHELWILGRERAKLHHGWRPAVHQRLRARFHEQPDGTRQLVTWRDAACLQCGAPLLDDDGIPLTADALAKTRTFCPACRAPAFGVDPKGPRRYAPAEFIKRHLHGAFDLLIADEIQELKGAQTGQGNAFGALASACRQTLALTGTLLGGYADDIFYLLWRSHAPQMAADGLDYRGVRTWMDRYGVVERVTKIRHGAADASYVRGKRQSSTTVRRKPGISPLVLGRHLLPTTIFLRLADVAEGLPPYEERVVNLAMSQELADAYRGLERPLIAAVRQALRSGSRRLLSTYLQALLCYPDAATSREETVLDPDSREPIAYAPRLDGALPKEVELLGICRQEQDQGRRVLVYATFTGTRDITPRLRSLLSHAGFRTTVLKGSVKPAEREAWIAERVREGLDVLIANPELVKTGLDLYAFPTFVFYETGYNIYTLRQAARRAWRIGQTEPCQVIFLTYQDTMQDKALSLIATKLEASLAIEGEITDAGLSALAEPSDSMVLELARALAHQVGSTSSAEAVWARLRKRQLEQELTLTAFRPAPAVTAVSQTSEQIGDKLLTIDLIERSAPRKQRVSRIDIQARDLARLLAERAAVAQLTLL